MYIYSNKKQVFKWLRQNRRNIHNMRERERDRETEREREREYMVLSQYFKFVNGSISAFYKTSLSECVKSKFQYVHVGTLLIYDLEVRTVWIPASVRVITMACNVYCVIVWQFRSFCQTELLLLMTNILCQYWNSKITFK